MEIIYAHSTTLSLQGEERSILAQRVVFKKNIQNGGSPKLVDCNLKQQLFKI